MMKKILFALLALLVAGLALPKLLCGQVIEADPVYPTVNDSVDIIFHVEQSECGLIEYTGDIYAHTGVLTNESEGSSDWEFVIAGWSENLEKAKLEKIDDTTHVLRIRPDLFTYYNLEETTVVEQLAFVFRSANGSEQTTDLFYEIYVPGLSVDITLPEGDVIIPADSVVPVTAVPVVLGTDDPDSLSLFINNELTFVSYTNELSYDFSSPVPGSYWMKIVADNSEYSSADSVLIFVREEITVADLPEGVRDGVNIVDNSTVTLVIYAPNKEAILAIGDFNNWEIGNEYLFNKTPDGNRFWLALEELTAGEEYAFQYLIDGSLRIADPYTEKILDPANDPYIPSATYPDLKPYPTGKTSGIVSVFQTDQEEYVWQTSSFTPAERTDLVIYELHVQNFTETGTIKALTDTLNYLVQLGVNAVELMPVNEFEGNQSWGYNPSFYFAFDKTYGSKNDFKAFVDACHSQGIAVIIDMVLNHSYSQSPLVRMYWNEASGRPSADNPWYNEFHNFVDNTSAQWGYDFNHESEATQNLVDSINSYWMSEYHVDGFRFDFTKGMSNTQWYGANNWASTYDADRIAILKRMSDEIGSRNENAIILFEHLADNSEETELADHGIMLWGNMNHEYNEATMGYPSNLNWGNYVNRGWSEPHLVTYMESHDEERLMYKNQRWGNSDDDYDVRDFATAMQRMEAAAVFFFTIPGPKMLFEWGELGYDYSINRCTDGTVDDNGGCRLTLKPVGWDLYEDPYRYRLNKIFEALIKLTIEEELFETEDFSLSTANYLKKMHLNSPSMNATILGNFSLNQNMLDPEFQHTGTWYDYLTGESLEVTDVHAEISLDPGEYLLYLDAQLEVPDIPVADPESNYPGQSDLRIYPNPSRGSVVIENEKAEAFIFEMYTLSGQKVFGKQFGAGTVTNILELDAPLPGTNSIYIYRLRSDRRTCQDLIILQR